MSVFSGINRVLSSAYLHRTLTAESNLRSEAKIIYNKGPVPEPQTILWVIGSQDDNLQSDETAWVQQCTL